MHHPYAGLIGLHIEEQRAGFSKYGNEPILKV
jgi:hypothetical protein